MDDLTQSERSLMASLPKPPESSRLRTTNIWIIEWLAQGERRTGKVLHDWMQTHRPGWSIYDQCNSKENVFASLSRAAKFAAWDGTVPILHIEAHGGRAGIAPSSDPRGEVITWEELTSPFQCLNTATKCNLMVVVAACLGFAAVQALRAGPRAPAVALVGPDANVNANDLLQGAKEFYRRFKDDSPRLSDIVQSASREMISAGFEPEPFALLAYEALVEQLISLRRPDEHRARIDRVRQKMLHETNFSPDEIEARLRTLPELPTSESLQQMWDKMFMFDLEPKNAERFGVAWNEIVDRILAASVE